MYVIGQGRAIRAPELQTILRRFATISGGQHFFTEDVSKLDRFFEEILAGSQQPVSALVCLS